MKTYRAKITGWVAGRRVQEGQAVILSEIAAQHEPVDEVTVAPPAEIEAPAEAPVKAPRKRRAKA